MFWVVSFFGQECRGMQSLCAGYRGAAPCWSQGVRVAGGDLCGNTAKAPTDAKRRQAHWQVKGDSHYRVKGETPCPGKVDACVNLYWVLPDADFRRICGFAATPLWETQQRLGGMKIETDTAQWTLWQAWHL